MKRMKWSICILTLLTTAVGSHGAGVTYATPAAVLLPGACQSIQSTPSAVQSPLGIDDIRLYTSELGNYWSCASSLPNLPGLVRVAAPYHVAGGVNDLPQARLVVEENGSRLVDTPMDAGSTWEGSPAFFKIVQLEAGTLNDTVSFRVTLTLRSLSVLASRSVLRVPGIQAAAPVCLVVCTVNLNVDGPPLLLHWVNGQLTPTSALRQGETAKFQVRYHVDGTLIPGTGTIDIAGPGWRLHKTLQPQDPDDGTHYLYQYVRFNFPVRVQRSAAATLTLSVSGADSKAVRLQFMLRPSR